MATFTVTSYYRDHQGKERQEGMQFSDREKAIEWARDWLKKPGRRAIVRQLMTQSGKRAGFFPMERIFDEQS